MILGITMAAVTAKVTATNIHNSVVILTSPHNADSVWCPYDVDAAHLPTL